MAQDHAIKLLVMISLNSTAFNLKYGLPSFSPKTGKTQKDPRLLVPCL